VRILLLNWKDPVDKTAGGAEEYVRRIAEEWAAMGHEVTLVVPSVRGRPRSENIGGVAYRRGGSRATVFFRALRLLRRNAGAYDRVLEAVSTRPFFSHTVVGDRAMAIHMQIADDVWQQEFPFPISWIGRRVLEPRWLGKMAGARVAAISPSTAADLARFRLHVETIAPPGCDTPEVVNERTTPGTPPRVVFLGRLIRTKRPLDALLAFEQIRAAFAGATLDVMGEGYLRGALVRRAQPGVRIHGWVDKARKRELLSGSDLMLIPGTREGWGITAMEAAAHGVPVVAYDIPGLRDAVEDRTTGVLTAQHPDALAEAAISLLREPQVWAALSRAGVHRAREFTWHRTAQTLLAALR
jgi:glycosyltransferase involved in cell wall biosynthesis